jgi:hypothetical protein
MDEKIAQTKQFMNIYRGAHYLVNVPIQSPIHIILEHLIHCAWLLHILCLRLLIEQWMFLTSHNLVTICE